MSAAGYCELTPTAQDGGKMAMKVSDNAVVVDQGQPGAEASGQAAFLTRPLTYGMPTPSSRPFRERRESGLRRYLALFTATDSQRRQFDVHLGRGR